jgi:hypothetical protein
MSTIVKGSAMFDPIDYYSPETRVFSAIAQSFLDAGTLHPAAFYLILDWKAPRARTKHRSRLAKKAGSFGRAVSEIAAELRAATTPEEKLRLLLTNWGFQLPTATAVLTVLYPDIFSVYDIRVCNMLRDFHKLGSRKWSSKTWEEYQRFISAVRGEAPPGLSLRDCDRWLWGKDKRERLFRELRESV